MGSKRNKVKKALSPVLPTNPDPEPVPDDDLMDDLFAQLDSRDKTVQTESANVLQEMNIDQVANDLDAAPKKDSKARYKARQARKAAALAEKYAPNDAEADARLQREAAEEERIIKKTCEELGVRIHEITPDGHCLFSAIADQLKILGIDPKATYATTRHAAADYIHSHPDDFIPFLPSAYGEDTAAATSDSGLMSPAEFDKYCKTMRDTGAWGGEPEILALSRAYNVPIHVIQGATPSVVVHEPDTPNSGGKVVRISYHRRMYGLGEHYNSLRPKGNDVVDHLKSAFLVS
ncbi:cysteine proteinase [Panus rudis PR-1116 ss-1]|nr:cysteine proteinase [Panus rudis PR-1116 ss-1]